MDCWDLNKACRKNAYPLHRIDQVVDVALEHELFKLHGRLLRLQPDQNATRRRGSHHLLYRQQHTLLQSHSLEITQHGGNLSKKYIEIEKYNYVFIVVARKFHSYFPAYKIIVLTDTQVSNTSFQNQTL